MNIARLAHPDEAAFYKQAGGASTSTDDLKLVYLVELDGPGTSTHSGLPLVAGMRAQRWINSSSFVSLIMEAIPRHPADRHSGAAS
jgi:hypothetical protein